MKPREQRFIKIEASFLDEILGLVIDKMLDKKAQNTLMLKLKFAQNTASLDVTNSSFKTVIFNPQEMLGSLDLRSIGHYKIKLGVSQQNLSNYFRFESADVLYEQFNKFVNTLRKEKEEIKDKFSWLDKHDERRNMSEKEILEKFINLEIMLI